MPNLGDEQFLRATTWRRDGSPVATAIWPVTWDEGKVAFLTAKPSGKGKRLRHTPRVELQPSDWFGVPAEGSTPVQGSVELVEGEELDRVWAAVLEKYGQGAWDSAMERGREAFKSQGIEEFDFYGVIVTFDD
ncbi:MAG TPA: pyridoxamine 5'-phosphate oxidase family protein [Baekduia sp.]|nr:pyridoxamine 5'-phosphate oxidase family protein [Baekduia sp.]